MSKYIFAFALGICVASSIGIWQIKEITYNMKRQQAAYSTVDKQIKELVDKELDAQVALYQCLHPKVTGVVIPGESGIIYSFDKTH